MTLALLVVTALLAGLAVLPLSRNPAWWIRAAEFPRLQLSLLLLATALLTLLLVPVSPVFWGLLTVQLACLAYQAWWIVPYTPLFPVEVKRSRQGDPERRLRIVTANILTPNRNAMGLIGLVEAHRPDILVTLESDAWWEEQLAPLEAEYPHTMRCPLDNLYGMHVYSRLPLTDRATKRADPGHALALSRMPGGIGDGEQPGLPQGHDGRTAGPFGGLSACLRGEPVDVPV